MVVGNDLGGLLAWTMAATHPEVVRGVVDARRGPSAAAALGGRAATRAQRHASGYALRTFQVPRRPEHLLTRDSPWVRELFDTWTGPRWRGTPGYVADVERYAEAMRIHPVVLLRGRVLPLAASARCRAATAAASPSRCARRSRAPVLQLHGDFDTCVLPSTAQGSGQYVTGSYEWRVLDGVGHFPHNEVPELDQRRADPLGQASTEPSAQPGVQRTRCRPRR